MAEDTTRAAFRALLRILNKLTDDEARRILDAAALLYRPPAA